MRSLALITAVFAIAGCATTAKKDYHAAPGVINLRRTSEHSFLTIQTDLGEANSRRPVRFVVDSGSEVSGILAAQAKDLQATGETWLILGIHGARLDGKVVRSPLRSPHGGHLFGDAQAVETELAVFPAGTRLPASAQGLLGMDFLSSTSAKLDIGEATLRSASAPPFSGDGAVVDLHRATADGGSLRFAVCEYGGRQLTWLVDTGASQTLLAQSTAEAIGLKNIGRRSQMIDSGGQRVVLRRGFLRESQWGRTKAVIENLPIGVVALPHITSLRLADGTMADGVMGIDMLTRYAAFIDFPNDTMMMWLPH